jgi:gluconolactonase
VGRRVLERPAWGGSADTIDKEPGAMSDALSAILETTDAERLATGFGFTEGPLWHPDGFYYFVDIRQSTLHRLIPGRGPELVRANTGEGNGTTFDLQGRLVLCEGGNRRVSRTAADGRIEILMDRHEGKRLNRPNDVVCRSDGSLFFTDPGLRVPLAERELSTAGVYRIAPDGTTALVADCEYPNGLAFSPDERTLYVANTRWAQYIHALEVDARGALVRRRIFADMSSDETDGVPDGMKVDVEGRVYCTGPGGTWVFAPDGTRLGIIRTPEVPANLAFGGPDLRTLFFTARTSVYTLRVKVPGQPHPWYRIRSRS